MPATVLMHLKQCTSVSVQEMSYSDTRQTHGLCAPPSGMQKAL
jgi:hypothetical protein